MGANDKNQSAINEVRDQLFLDNADQHRLNTVSANLGITRPVIGSDDDEWRAFVKEIALQPKLVENTFYRALEVLAGPQHSRIANLSENTLANITKVTTVNGENLLQLGTVIVDPGLSTEETVTFGYRDLDDNTIYFNSELHSIHTAVTPASNYLANTTNAGVSSLVLRNTSSFPTTGYPYAIIIDTGTTNEELLVVTNNNTSTNTLTLQNVTTKKHYGAQSTGFLSSFISENIPAKSTLVFIGGTRSYPNNGYLRINAGQSTEEVVQYTTNDIDNHVFILNWPTTYTHLTTVISPPSPPETVELVTPGAIVSTLNLYQQGTNWNIYQTEPNKVKIYLPTNAIRNNLVDAPFLHDIPPSAASTTVDANGYIGDTTLTVASTASFRTGTGAILIDSLTYIQYAHVIDSAHFQLAEPLLINVTTGMTVDSVPVNYSGTQLEEGNLRTSSGSVNTLPEFSGPYLYSFLDYGIDNTKTKLTEVIPPTAINQSVVNASQTCIEVDDISLWPTSPFTSFSVKIDRDLGSEETATATLIVPKTTSTTVFTATTTAIVGADFSDFPFSSVASYPCGYYVHIAAGTARDEIIRVASVGNSIHGTMTFYTDLSYTHLVGDTIELIHDVIVVDHVFKSHNVGATVEKVFTELSVNSVSGFPDSGSVWINFGSGRPSVRKKLTNQLSPTSLEFDSTSAFPTSDYPYRITVGEGTYIQEYGMVSNNNTTSNILTLNSSLSGSFSPGQYIEYCGGTPTIILYTGKGASSLTFTEGVIFDTLHEIGESVIYSPDFALPNEDGSGFGFHLTQQPVKIFADLVKLVRAAGVEVLINDIPVGI